MQDPSFKSQAMPAAGTEVRVELKTTGAPATPLTITTLTNENPAKLTAVDVGGTLQTGDTVQFAGTGKVEADGKSFTLGAKVLTDFEVLGLDGSGWATSVGAGTVSEPAMADACETTGWTGFDGQAGEIEVTTLCSYAKEFIGDLPDSGNFNMDLNFVQTDPAIKELEAAKQDRVPRVFEILFPNGWVRRFSAYVRQFSLTAQRGQAVTGAVSTRITGAYVDIEPATP